MHLLKETVYKNYGDLVSNITRWMSPLVVDTTTKGDSLNELFHERFYFLISPLAEVISWVIFHLEKPSGIS
jgi:hypothetical protein